MQHRGALCSSSPPSHVFNEQVLQSLAPTHLLDPLLRNLCARFSEQLNNPKPPQALKPAQPSTNPSRTKTKVIPSSVVWILGSPSGERHFIRKRRIGWKKPQLPVQPGSACHLICRRCIDSFSWKKTSVCKFTPRVSMLPYYRFRPLYLSRHYALLCKLPTVAQAFFSFHLDSASSDPIHRSPLLLQISWYDKNRPIPIRSESALSCCTLSRRR